MNTLAFLLLTTCTPAADPMPVIDSRLSAVPTYGNYGSQEFTNPTQENRPRFFPRLRGLFSRKPQGMDNRITESSSAYPYQMTTNGAMGNTIISSTPMPLPSTSANPITSTPIHSQPIITSPSSSGLQRMPTGQPSPSGNQPF
jgi:hypothetical protein